MEKATPRSEDVITTQPMLKPNENLYEMEEIDVNDTANGEKDPRELEQSQTRQEYSIFCIPEGNCGFCCCSDHHHHHHPEGAGDGCCSCGNDGACCDCGDGGCCDCGDGGCCECGDGGCCDCSGGCDCDCGDGGGCDCGDCGGCDCGGCDCAF